MHSQILKLKLRELAREALVDFNGRAIPAHEPWIEQVIPLCVNYGIAAELTDPDAVKCMIVLRETGAAAAHKLGLCPDRNRSYWAAGQLAAYLAMTAKHIANLLTPSAKDSI